MPRKNLIRSQYLPYHVTARCNNREPFPCNLDRVWKVLCDQCFETQMLYEIQVHAFVLMPNHFHLLVSTPHEDLGIAMQRFMSSGTKTLNRISDRSGRIFGAQYHYTLIDSAHYFSNVLKYVYRNPVRAGLCKNVEDHPYGTLAGILGSQHLPIPISYPYGENKYLRIPNDIGEMVDWFNRPFNKEAEKIIRAGLRKTEFIPAKLGWKRSIEEFAKLLE